MRCPYPHMPHDAPPISLAVERVSISDPFAVDEYTHAFPTENEGLQEHDEEAINFEENRQRANNGEDERPGGVFLG